MNYAARNSADLAAIYGGLAARVDDGITADTTYGDVISASAFKWMKANYATGIGPWKVNLLPRVALDPKVDANGDGNAELATRNTGRVHPMLGRAIQAGLLVHPYTMRAEESFLTQAPNGVAQTVIGEAVELFSLGVNGMFFDQPDLGVAARDIFLDVNEPSGPR